jgi:DNA-binding MarR family transcriptional regulator
MDLEPEDDKDLDKLEGVAELFATSMSPTMPMQLYRTFLMIIRNEGKSLSEIADIIGTNSSTASRHLLDLGERNRKMEPGYMLVESRADPMNLRRKVYTLTPKGKLLARSILKKMKD